MRGLAVMFTALVALLYPRGAVAQEVYRHHFDQDKSQVHTGIRLSQVVETIDSLYQHGELQRVLITGAASPDGSETYNHRLALSRAERLKFHLQQSISLPDSLIEVSTVGEDWDGFVRCLPDTFEGYDLTILHQIIENVPNLAERKRLIRKAELGRLWERLKSRVLPSLRYASISVERRSALFTPTETGDTLASTEHFFIAPYVEEETLEATVLNNEFPDILPPPAFKSHWYLKSNLPAWGMLWMNVAAEIDLARHWSVSLPVYYSGFNYFKRSLKFRTLAIQPQVRWWPALQNDGFFLGAHLGMAYFNYAKDGDFRYQDHDANTPALGGGIGIGYRWNVGKSGRWAFEASIGAGVYHLDYDIFKNCTDGLLTGRERRTFVGIDNAALSVVYRFELSKKKGGDRQ